MKPLRSLAALALAAGLTCAPAAVAAATAPTAAASGAAGASVRASTGNEHLTSRSVPALAAVTPCQSFYCDFSLTSYRGLCFESQGNNSNWNNNGLACRNHDESIANDTGFYLRLYYGPNASGAWVCLNKTRAISSLAGIKFNNGKGLSGYGSNVENDVASSYLSQGKCTNGI
jgi:hypothetical protein